MIGDRTKKQAKKVGFQVFVRAVVSEIVYNFLSYAGLPTILNVQLEEKEQELNKSAQFVTMLCKTIPDGLPSAVVFDNFFAP